MFTVDFCLFSHPAYGVGRSCMWALKMNDRHCLLFHCIWHVCAHKKQSQVMNMGSDIFPKITDTAWVAWVWNSFIIHITQILAWCSGQSWFNTVMRSYYTEVKLHVCSVDMNVLGQEVMNSHMRIKCWIWFNFLLMLYNRWGVTYSWILFSCFETLIEKKHQQW